MHVEKLSEVLVLTVCFQEPQTSLAQIVFSKAVSTVSAFTVISAFATFYLPVLFVS